ncbi:MAG: phosphatase PAP2 family protein [Rickettsiaceae bacterium]|nr:phosphatase PAP2 family protein [Rickettsiaceae bacterium]
MKIEHRELENALVLNKMHFIIGGILLILSFILFFFPDMDRFISGLFYSQNSGFVLNKNFIVVVLHDTIPTIKIIYGFILLGIAIFKILIDDVTKSLLFFTVLISLIVGPGIIVNNFLKDNFGRARPREITEFGGIKEFSRPYVISDQCIKNCSFSSGHAAGGFSFASIAYIVSQKYSLCFFWLGLSFGFCVGIARIVQGAHFLSDVLASGGVVLLVNCLFMKLYLMHMQKK